MVERKASVRQSQALSGEQMLWLRDAFPDIALKMIRNSFHYANMNSPTVWLRDNCSGFYHMPNSSNVMFERDEDALLFKLAFDGK